MLLATAGWKAGDSEGIEIIRSPVESVTVHRDKTRSNHISMKVTRRLTSLLAKPLVRMEYALGW